MSLKYTCLLLGLSGAISVYSGTITEQYNTCAHACSNAQFEEALATGELQPEDAQFMRDMFEHMYEEMARRVVEHCLDSDISLLADSFCYGAEHNLCTTSSVAPNLSDYPPFNEDAVNVPAELLEMINGRELSAACREIKE